MASIDDILATAAPRTETVRLSLRSDLASEHDRLEEELAAAVDDERLLDIAERMEAIQAEIRSSAVEFVLAGIGKRRWSELVADNPPTAEQVEQLGRRVPWNPDTFVYAAIAACVREPAGITVEKAASLEDVLTVAEWQRLWEAVLVVNVGDRSPGESLAASVVLRRLRPSSEPRERMAFPAASSSGAA